MLLPTGGKPAEAGDDEAESDSTVSDIPAKILDPTVSGQRRRESSLRNSAIVADLPAMLKVRHSTLQFAVPSQSESSGEWARFPPARD
jgi:hypothetical protein